MSEKENTDEVLVGFVRSFLTTMELSTYLTIKEKLTLFGKSTIRNVFTICRTIYKLQRVPFTTSSLIHTNLLISNGTTLCMRTDANQKRSVKKMCFLSPVLLVTALVVRGTQRVQNKACEVVGSILQHS